MRALVLLIIVIATVPFILRQPHIGVYVWSWLGYMNPHRLAWSTFPFAEVVAGATLIAILFTKEPRKIPWTRESVVLLVFVVWMLVTTIFAEYQDLAWEKWDKVWKIQLFIFITLMFITDQKRLQILIWVIVLSLGFFGVKGGIFTIQTGGVHLVLGPEGSFIQNRGDLGTALNMTIPLMRYLQLSTQNKWIRIGLTVAMVLTCFAIIGTHSRGAFLGLAAVMLFLIMKSRRRFILTLLLVATAYSVLNFMPSMWSERIQTIQTYEEDRSAMGRIDAWRSTISYVTKYHPILGAGFGRDTGGRAAHNIFIQVLGDHGYVGLILFAGLGLLTWMSAGKIRKRVKHDPELKWMGDLMAMVQVCLIGYGSGGFFLSLAYFDLTYHLMAFVVICRVLLLQHEKEKSEQRVEVPGWRRQDRVFPD